MLVNKFLKVVLLLLGGIFILFQGFALEAEGAIVSTIMLVLLTILYHRFTENKTKYFLWFLIIFTTAHFWSLLSWYLPEIPASKIDYHYYGANILYIISYIFLIVKVLVNLKFREVFAELSIPIIILLILDVFCVVVVTDTAEGALSFSQYILEFIYNSVIMALLSSALINYMYRNDNKSMQFLIGSICIVFSEIIQLAYYYILLDDQNLGLIYSFFLVVAFSFFYAQSQLQFTGPIPSYLDEQLEEV
ncbi:hypothetical protein [Winogradskyella sp. PE311]|uniref:hypothetical protein n=1 Tax=Winogradskyella sp. PE311 TaxID=3366943 RepID=UPI00397EA7B8